jgi:MOSC domain-containing protein YiiM
VWKGRTVTTGIFKESVAGRVPLRQHNLDGDAQADLSVHGSPYKAVYLYPAEHYAAWRQELPGIALPWGMFGENFTMEGISEGTVQIGNRLGIGTAVVRVTEPRTPCYKLAYGLAGTIFSNGFWRVVERGCTWRWSTRGRWKLERPSPCSAVTSMG